MRKSLRSQPSAIRSLLVLVCAAQIALAAAGSGAHVRNFGEVNGQLYRGGEPSLVGLQELGAMGVKLVIDLRESGEGTEFEKSQVERLGMKYLNIPFRPMSAPTIEQVQKVLTTISSANSGPVFLHCRRGKDRTGTAIACYRIQHDGWDNRKALAEAHAYGMSFTERGMRSFVLHFSPQGPALPGNIRIGVPTPGPAPVSTRP